MIAFTILLTVTFFAVLVNIYLNFRVLESIQENSEMKNGIQFHPTDGFFAVPPGSAGEAFLQKIMGTKLAAARGFPPMPIPPTEEKDKEPEKKDVTAGQYV
jgi:hypothetical protein